MEQDKRDLAAFIRARLGDNHRIATTAWIGTGEWKQANPVRHPGHILDSELDTVVYDEGAPGEYEAEHIARHDPARILSQSAALSDVLTELEQIVERSSHPDAVEHAAAAIRRLALIWLSVEEMEERFLR